MVSDVNLRGLKAVPNQHINYGIVFIHDEKVYGEILSFGSYASKVRYSKNGIQYEVTMLNEDFEIIEEVNIEIEEEY